MKKPPALDLIFSCWNLVGDVCAAAGAAQTSGCWFRKFWPQFFRKFWHQADAPPVLEHPFLGDGEGAIPQEGEEDVGVLKRHEIQVLLKAGHSRAEVARLAGISLRSVKRIAQEADVTHVDDAGARRTPAIGRPSVVQRFRKFVAAVLQEEPALRSVEVLRRARGQGYTGGKTAFYAVVAEARPKEVRPLVRFEGLPGEFSQHDFGQVDVTYLGGVIRRIRFFASRLKYTRTVRVSLVLDETVETLVRTLADHLHSWGGAPLMCVFDRPKTVALKWRRDGVVTEWNPTFAYVALELGIGVEVCWPYRAQEKGSVENLVGFREGLVLQAASLPGRGGSAPAARRLAAGGQRRAALPGDAGDPGRPPGRGGAPAAPAQSRPSGSGAPHTGLRRTHGNGHPRHASVLDAAGGDRESRARCTSTATGCASWPAVHARQFIRGEGATLPAHRTALVAAVSGKRGKRDLKRQLLLDLGEPPWSF